jgi:osmotically inducible lipoprotein OsmB
VAGPSDSTDTPLRRRPTHERRGSHDAGRVDAEPGAAGSKESLMPHRLSPVARRLALATALVAGGALGACSSMSDTQRDTAIGAAVGGVAGSVLTGGSTAGTVGGAVIGGVIGNERKKK